VVCLHTALRVNCSLATDGRITRCDIMILCGDAGVYWLWDTARYDQGVCCNDTTPQNLTNHLELDNYVWCTSKLKCSHKIQKYTQNCICSNIVFENLLELCPNLHWGGAQHAPCRLLPFGVICTSYSWTPTFANGSRPLLMPTSGHLPVQYQTRTSAVYRPEILLLNTVTMSSLPRKYRQDNLLRLTPFVKPCSRCHRTDSILASRVQPLLYMKYTYMHKSSRL